MSRASQRRRMMYGRSPVMVCCPYCGRDTLNLRNNVCEPCKDRVRVTLTDIEKAYKEACDE